MSGYRVAHLDEIEEVSDGLRPIRLHLGITAFGVNAFIGRHAGDRIVKEHDEANELRMAEELYLVQTGRARFELDGEQVADANPQYPVLKYNLACCESLAGQSDDAIEHLRQAIGESAKDRVFPGIRSFAAGDSDFDSIRDESAFKELVGQA